VTGIPGQLSAANRADIRAKLRQSAGEFLQRFYRHDVLVARAVRGIQIEAAQRFRMEVAEPLIRAIAGGLAGFEPRGPDVTPANFPELDEIIREAEAIIEQGVESVRMLTEERMRDIGQGEVDFVSENAAKTLGEPVPTTPAGQEVRRPWLGDDTERWFSKMLVQPTGDAVRQRITQGMQQGQTVDQIVGSIRGTRTQAGVLDASTQAVGTLVRTAATSASAQARGETFKELGVTHWRFLATLDSKTTVQCAANDGKSFLVGEGPMPPLHPNCRSVAVPDFRGKPIGTRASIDGQVPAATDYESWLATQSISEQNTVLGKTKAEAWRAGKITLKQMLGRDLQPLTLAELRRLDRS
jgi:SPP1 gp7 family putative phage head morphogenesis protein